MDKRGWKLNLLQNPKGFHLCLTHVHTLVEGFEDRFIHDLKSAVDDVMTYPADKKPGGNVKVYGAVGMLPTAIQRAICIDYQKVRLALKSCVGFFSSQSHEEEQGSDIRNAVSMEQ